MRLPCKQDSHEAAIYPFRQKKNAQTLNFFLCLTKKKKLFLNASRSERDLRSNH